MLLILTTSNIQFYFTLYHDINGNLIGELNNKIFWLDINKESVLEFIELENPDALYNVKNGKINYNKINNIPQDSLKKKLIDSIADDDEQEHFPEELEEDEQYVNDRNIYNYLPETKDYYIENNKNSDDDSDDEGNDDEIKFNFSVLNSNKDIILEEYKKTFDAPSIYDIIVKNNNLVVFTSEAYPYSSYKISILDNNIFELNIIGSSIKQYELKYLDDKLIFVIPYVNIIEKKSKSITIDENKNKIHQLDYDEPDSNSENN